MRGLAGDDDSARGGIGRWAASSAAVAALAAFGLFAAGCSTGGTGTRDEGPARTDPVAQAPSSPEPAASSSPVKKVDALQLVLEDPKVSNRVKADLKACAKDAYPIDTSYGNITGSPVPDVVVNVLTCGDAVGVGTYVYRADDGGYANVFAAEEPAVYATIDRGDLIVTKQVYAKGDSVSYPSGQVVITYRWTGNKFTEHDRVENEYSRAVGGDVGDDPVPTAPRKN